MSKERRLTLQDLYEPAAAVADSLLHEPFYQAITTDHRDNPAQRVAVLRAYMAYSLAESQRTGRLVLAPNPAEGAAAWLLPRTAAIDARESAAKSAFLRATLGRAGFANYQRIVAFMRPPCKSVVPSDAWYLSILGVLPATQGRGIGAQLLQPTLKEADAAGAVSYLESFSERNPAFYGRLGFNTIATHCEPTTNAPYRIMLRARPTV